MTTPTINVRQAAPGDWPELRRLRLAALDNNPEWFNTDIPGWHARSDDWWQAYAERGASGDRELVVVADTGGGLAGMAHGALDETGSTATFGMLWIEPGHRRNGLANQFARELTGWAQDRGARLARSWVTVGNHASEALHQAHGWVPTTDTEATRTGGIERRWVCLL